MPMSRFCAVLRLISLLLPVNPMPSFHYADLTNGRSFRSTVWLSGLPALRPPSTSVPEEQIDCATDAVFESVKRSILESRPILCDASEMISGGSCVNVSTTTPAFRRRKWIRSPSAVAWATIYLDMDVEIGSLMIAAGAALLAMVQTSRRDSRARASTRRLWRRTRCQTSTRLTAAWLACANQTARSDGTIHETLPSRAGSVEPRTIWILLIRTLRIPASVCGRQIHLRLAATPPARADRPASL